MNEITHWEGCWLDGRAHYSCAITHIASLTVRAERAEAALRQLGREPDDCLNSHDEIACVSELARQDALARAERLQAELAEARGYGSRLFLRLNPQCEVFDNMPGLMTQFDNYIAGQLQDIAAEKAARERAEQEVVMLKEALLFTHSAAVGITPDWLREEIMQKLRAALEG